MRLDFFTSLNLRQLDGTYAITRVHVRGWYTPARLELFGQKAEVGPYVSVGSVIDDQGRELIHNLSNEEYLSACIAAQEEAHKMQEVNHAM
jgi:hypothetical protein